jgi:hypothetical protein
MDAHIEIKSEELLEEYLQEAAGRQERIAEPTCDCPLPAEAVLAQYIVVQESSACPPMFVP